MISRNDFDMKMKNLFEVLERKPNEAFCDDLYKAIKDKFERPIVYKVVARIKYSGKRFFTIEDFVNSCTTNETSRPIEVGTGCGCCYEGLVFYENPEGYEFVARCGMDGCTASLNYPNYPLESSLPFDFTKRA